MRFPELTAEEAAEYIKNDYVVGIGGFSSVGTPRLCRRHSRIAPEAEHAKGNEFRVGLITGGATGDPIDGALARAHAVKFRTPFRPHKDMRAAINSQEVQYFDLNLSHVAQDLRYGFLGHMDVCIIEASSITEDGHVVPTSSVGISPTLCQSADKIIIELNAHHPEAIRGMHDIYEPINPPYRREIPIYTPA